MKKIKKLNILIFITLSLLLTFSSIKIYDVVFYEQNKLKSLNYSDEFINKVIDLDLAEYVINKNIYSKNIEISILNNTYDHKYLDEYYKIKYRKFDNYIENINKLLKLGYSIKDIDSIYIFQDSASIDKIISMAYDSELTNYIVYNIFKIDSFPKYKIYKEIHNISIENSIVYVNIGLDHEFYTQIKNIENPDDLLVVVNKYNKLPSEFVPSDLKVIPGNFANYDNMQLKSIACDKFTQLATDMKAMNSSLVASSSYRSYDYQQTLYDSYVAKDGVLKADTYSARAGHSEHQTGLAIDVIIDGFSWSNIVNSPNYTWFVENIHKYGFIISYNQNSTNISGYMYEPWHIRYVGIDIATKVYELNITFDVYSVKYLHK